MADKYWWPSGGTGSSTGNWNSTTNWSSSSASYVSTTAPTSTDNANFGSYSGASAFTVTVSNLIATCADLIINNSNMTWAGLSGTAGITISGGVTITAFASRTFNGTITFSTANSVVLNFGSMTFSSSSFTFSGGGTWTLGSALTTASAITLISGTLDTSPIGNYSLTASSLNLGAGTKTLNLNASTVTLSGATPISFATNATGFTLNAGTSQITCSNLNAAFAGGGFTFYNVNFTTTSLASYNITGTNTFNNFSVAARSIVGVSFVLFGANQTINGTLTVPAPTTAGSSRYHLRSSTYGVPITLTGNTASLTDVDFRDITHSGTTWTGTRLGDAGGNSGITFATPKDVFWNLAGSQNWNANGWATTPSGTPATTNFPLPQDTAYFSDINPAPGSIVTLNVSYNLPAIDFFYIGRSNALTFATGTISPYAYGSITLSSAITLTGTGIITWGHRSGTKTITSAGRTWTQSFAFSNKTATVLFGDAFTATGASGITHTHGTLDAQTYNVTCVTFTTSALNTRTLGLGSGTWTITGSGASAWSALTSSGLTLVPGTSTISMTSASAKTFIGGAKTYYNLNQGGAGALTIQSNNTFNNITNSVQPTTVTFTASSTNTFANFSLMGTAGNLVTINSSTAGTLANIVKTGDVVSTVDYVSIRDSSATPSTLTWYAGAHSTNVSNNSGWIFSAVPILTQNYGNFLLFFG